MQAAVNCLFKVCLDIVKRDPKIVSAGTEHTTLFFVDSCAVTYVCF